MNFCTKCASYYTKPGTCNCFAEPPQDAAPWLHPIVTPPLTWPPAWVPYVSYTDSTTGATSITITNNDDTAGKWVVVDGRPKAGGA